MDLFLSGELIMGAGSPLCASIIVFYVFFIHFFRFIYILGLWAGLHKADQIKNIFKTHLDVGNKPRQSHIMLREQTQNKCQGDLKMCEYENTNYRADTGCGCANRENRCSICNFCGLSEDTLLLIAIIILFILLFCGGRC